MITILQNTETHELPHMITMNVFTHEVGHSFGAKVNVLVCIFSDQYIVKHTVVIIFLPINLNTCNRCI